MELIRTVSELRGRVRVARSVGGRVGLVPTMGAFHAGHLSLMQAARAACELVVVSLFVNPTQFGPGEDLERYPRDLDGDAAMAASVGVDALFAPAVQEVYAAEHATTIHVAGVTEHLCGASRPGHFSGVATVVAKLLHMAQPDVAYFGRKDYQQLQVIRRLVADLNIPVEVVGCPIVREPDGLAMSSRNRYLSEEDRARALSLVRGLWLARRAFEGGEREASALTALAGGEIRTAGASLEYAELVDAESLAPLRLADRAAVLAVAARVGPTRLIDNLEFPAS